MTFVDRRSLEEEKIGLSHFFLNILDTIDYSD